MGITSRRSLSHPVSLVGRLRTRLTQVAAAGALVGCLYGGVALSVAAAPAATVQIASASHAVAGVQPNIPCGAIPFPC